MFCIEINAYAWVVVYIRIRFISKSLLSSLK